MIFVKSERDANAAKANEAARRMREGRGRGSPGGVLGGEVAAAAEAHVARAARAALKAAAPALAVVRGASLVASYAGVAGPALKRPP